MANLLAFAVLDERGARFEPASALALTTQDWLLLAAVVGGGLSLTWVVMRLVLRETAAFSAHFPREDAAPDAEPPASGDRNPDDSPET